eukprot:Phypoly_transcript_11151.p1 GENE.Phypoly_transcript_11151~~Phypoly_transcript_11151.p1  ORF type:complete len:348 (+),score=29.06 Phypoly_transcript_11151:145-1188(+)
MKPVAHTMRAAFVTGGSGFVGQVLIGDLRQLGVTVYALARSQHTIKLLQEAGAIPIHGDLNSKQALLDGMVECDTVFHCASTLGVWVDDYEKLYRDNVLGTINVLEAAKKSNHVSRFIYVGSITAIFGGSDMNNVDETYPYPNKYISTYSRTKAEAEIEVLKANSEKLQTMSVRLPAVWGPADPILPGLVRMAKWWYWVWPANGQFSITQLYVANATSGLIAAAVYGKGGEIYHLSDDKRPTFREFFSGRLRSCGCTPWQLGDTIFSRSFPAWILWILVVICEILWRFLPLPGSPPIPREGIAIATAHFSVDDTKARRELGWKPPVSHEEGTRREGEWYKKKYNIKT